MCEGQLGGTDPRPASLVFALFWYLGRRTWTRGVLLLRVQRPIW